MAEAFVWEIAKLYESENKSIEETPSGPNKSVVIPHDPWDPVLYAIVESN